MGHGSGLSGERGIFTVHTCPVTPGIVSLYEEQELCCSLPLVYTMGVSAELLQSKFLAL